jgi:hypothetical protein
VAAGDGDAALGAEAADGELKAGRGADAEVYDLAAGREQARDDAREHHRPRRPRVAADEHAPRVEVAGEPLREADDQLRRESLADDPADSADAYLERIHGAGREDNRVARAGSSEKVEGGCEVVTAR